jgi:hypothetical protein
MIVPVFRGGMAACDAENPALKATEFHARKKRDYKSGNRYNGLK